MTTIMISQTRRSVRQGASSSIYLHYYYSSSGTNSHTATIRKRRTVTQRRRHSPKIMTVIPKSATRLGSKTNSNTNAKTKMRMRGMWTMLSIVSLILMTLIPTASAAATTTSTNTIDLLGGAVILSSATAQDQKQAQSFADLSQDVAEIAALLQQGQSEQALGLYRNGRHAQMYNSQQLLQLRSLASLADGLIAAQPKTPAFVFHLVGQPQETSSTATAASLNLALDSDKLSYMNRQVEEYLTASVETESEGSSPSQSSPLLAVEAIQTLNLWMHATHLLYQSVWDCYQRARADVENDSDNNSFLQQHNPKAAWNQFLALWIGSGQQPGQSNGNALYAWAQRNGQRFQTTTTSTTPANTPPTLQQQTTVNTRIVLWYHEAKTLLASETACSKQLQEPLNDLHDDAAANPTVARLWQLTQNVVREMTRPLLQGWMTALADQNAARARLYAQAIVPQLTQCRPSLYQQVREWSEQIESSSNDPNANDPSQWNAAAAQQIWAALPQVTYCWGYSLEELGTLVGNHTNSGNNTTNSTNNATNSTHRPNLAGYVPLTKVGNVAAVDLDIYQMGILTSLNSNTFAEFIYLHGANVAKYPTSPAPGGSSTNPNDPLEYVSLHDIAISSERSNAQPFFDIFVSYHNQKNYADIALRQALAGKSKWVAAQQVSAIVTTTAAFQILWMEAVTKLKIAVQECRSVTDPRVGITRPLNPIDEAAALLIGSMEGSNLGGSSNLEDGQLIFNIANRHAFEFHTFTQQYQYAMSVSTIQDLLFAARGELDSLACDQLQETTDSIIRYSLVGITQACIDLAVGNENLRPQSTGQGLAQAEGLALAILPLVHNENPTLAENIANNLIRVQGEETVPDGGKRVAQWLGQAFSETLQLSCYKNLGAMEFVAPCEGVVCDTSDPPGIFSSNACDANEDDGDGGSSNDLPKSTQRAITAIFAGAFFGAVVYIFCGAFIKHFVRKTPPDEKTAQRVRQQREQVARLTARDMSGMSDDVV